MGGGGGLDGFGAAELQLVVGGIDLDPDAGAGGDLIGRDHGGEGLGEETVDGAVELAGAVFGAGALLQEKLAGFAGDVEDEAAIAEAGVDVVLEVDDLLVEDGGEGLGGEGLIGDDGVDTVDEFGGEALADGNQGDGLKLGGEVAAIFLIGGLKAELGIDLAHHLARAQVGGQEDEGLFEIDGRVVAEAEDALVEDAEEEAGHGRRGLLDFIEQNQ